jgi:hypothetical protein
MDQAPAKAKRRTRQKSHLQIRLTTEIVQNKKPLFLVVFLHHR